MKLTTAIVRWLAATTPAVVGCGWNTGSGLRGRDPLQRRRDHHHDGSGPRGRADRRPPRQAWCRWRRRPGEYWWARVPVRIGWQPGREHRLLARRSITTGEITYYVCWGPRRTRLVDLARIAGTRWAIGSASGHQARSARGKDGRADPARPLAAPDICGGTCLPWCSVSMRSSGATSSVTAPTLTDPEG